MQARAFKKHIVFALAFFCLGVISSHGLLLQKVDKLIDTKRIDAPVNDFSESTDSLRKATTLMQELQIMMIEQQQFVEATEGNIASLVAKLDGVYGIQNQTVSDILPEHSELQESGKPNSQSTAEAYTLSESFVNEKANSGVWGYEDAQRLRALSEHLTHTQKSRLKLEIVHAINRGDIQIENMRVPLF